MSVLQVDGLSIRYGDKTVVSGVSFGVDRSESIGLVGESGCGKTQTALAILGLLPAAASVEGSIVIDGQQVVGAPARALRKLRAVRIGMVFQDPAAAINPYVPIGKQLRRILLEHGIAAGQEADQRVMHMLDKVGLPDPGRQFRAYAHQLSGGMRQRVMIAAALIAEPDIVIADEPTTALDVTVQAQILELLERIREETGLLLITHDLAVVAGHCERVLVMDQGSIVEAEQTRKLFSAPVSDEAREMIAAAPRFDAAMPPQAFAGEAVLEVSDVTVSYRERESGEPLLAVHPLGFTLGEGETLGVVGESGSGKSSLIRGVLGLIPMQAGTVVFNGAPIGKELQARSREARKDLQLVFQDPVGSLNPQMRVQRIIAEPLTVHAPGLDAAGRMQRARDMLQRVGLDEATLSRYPHELSGGQAQRVAIARALIVNPRVLVCDEAVAALDGRVRGQIISLLQKEQSETGLAIIFISHDLAVVRSISHRVLVLYLGHLVELASGARLFSNPRHPYTRALLDAVPVPDPLRPGGRLSVGGEAPSALSPPPGCAFHPRCAHAVDRCRNKAPQERALDETLVACHRADEISL